MIRPNNLKLYDNLDLKLGIKSSLPDVKSVIGLVTLLFISEEKPSNLYYAESKGKTIEIKEDVFNNLYLLNQEILNMNEISRDTYKEIVNENRIFKSQLEALLVGFSLIWEIADVRFEDTELAMSAERKGGNRYPKIIGYTTNLDIIYQLYKSDKEGILRILLSWIGVELKSVDKKLEKSLLYLLNIFSEKAIFRSRNENRDETIFNLNSIYELLLEGEEYVYVNDALENTGPLRIFKSSLDDKMHPFIEYEIQKGIKIRDGVKEELSSYSARVDKLLELQTFIIPEKEQSKKTSEKTADKSVSITQLDSIRGINKLYFGAPGSGKSYAIGEFIRNNGVDKYDESMSYENVFRITLHPDYSYSDFIGQVMPVVEKTDKGNNITYDFKEGPFTTVLDYSLKNPKIPVFLILEELSRANVASVFGDIFQLLDRDKDGTSEYSINNELISKFIYEDLEETEIRIPNNVYILGTVNTSDQNVFVMDTAFKRRFEFEYIDANQIATDSKNNALNNYEFILEDKDHNLITLNWIDLYQALNKFIVSKNNGLGLPEDKQLGQFFIKFIEGEGEYNYNQILNKLLEYLWSDVQSISYSDISIFKNEIDSFSKLYNTAEKRINFFSQAFLDLLV